jgi:hypothetical protein
MAPSALAFDQWGGGACACTAGSIHVHCNKRLAIFPSPAWWSLTNSPWPRIIKLFPAMDSLVSDIPAGDGKIVNLFLQCRNCSTLSCSTYIYSLISHYTLVMPPHNPITLFKWLLVSVDTFLLDCTSVYGVHAKSTVPLHYLCHE